MINTKKKFHDLKEFPLMDWGWGVGSRRARSYFRDYEQFKGMPQPSKCLFELKQKQKSAKITQWEACRGYVCGSVAFFLQLPPESIPGKTEWYHP